ncbi:MAG: glycerol-3-phosphate acyltransferase [Roseburia sp.]|nr:glycerol-3-phosphate acyltransferase [Roseburia sp.]
MKYILFIMAGYLSGSVMYAYILPKWIKGIDITKLSKDKNPGTANAFLCAGVPIGIAAVLCELLKGAIPVYGAARVLDREFPLFALVMAAPVFGHAYSAFHKGKGGKAIAVSFGVAIGLYPDTTMLFLMIFFFLLFSLVLVIRPHLLRAILTFMCVGISSSFLLENRAQAAGILIIALIVIVRHWTTYHGEKLELYLLKKRIG